MVGYANFSGAAHKIANPQYAAQVAKLQQLRSMLDNSYKWSHREIKEFLINVISTFAVIEGSAGISDLGIDLNDPSSWENLNNGGGGNDGGNNGNTQNPITKEDLLNLLEGFKQYANDIDVDKLFAEIQSELIDSQLFKDLMQQLLDQSTQALIAAAMADEEQKRIEADAEVLEKTATMYAKEAKDRVDALVLESETRANQFIAEAEERNRLIFEESQARIAADEAEIQARKDAIDEETKARTDAVKKESDDRVEAIRTAAETAQNNLIAESTKLGTKITDLESVTTEQAQQISTISASNRQEIAAAIQEEKTARIAADEAEALERQTLATQLQDDIAAGISTEQSARASDKAAQAIINADLSAKLSDAKSEITSEQSARVTADEAQTNLINEATSRIGDIESNITSIERTVADNEQALSTKIEGLQSKFGNIDVGGRNLLIGTKSGIIESSGNSNTETINYQFSPNVDVETIKDFTVSCEIDLKKAKFQSGTTNGRVGVEVQLTYTDDSVEYKNVWLSDFATPKTVKQKLKLTSSVNKDKTIREIKGVIQVRNISSTSVKVYNAKLEKGNIATDWTEAPEDIGVEINEVSAKVDTVKETLANDDKALAQRIDTLNSTFNANKADIDSKYQTLADKDTALTSQLETLETSVNNNYAAIQEEKTTRTNNESSVALQIGELTTKYNLADAAIEEEAKARADADSAQVSTTTGLAARLDGAEGRITAEETARAEADIVVTGKIETLTSDYNDSKAKLTQLADTYATDKEASGQRMSGIETSVQDNLSKISTLETSLTTKESALSRRIDLTNAEVDENKSAITNETQARTDAFAAQASVNQTLTGKIGNAESLIAAETSARTTADESINRNLTGLIGRVENAEGRITTEEQTRVSEDQALSSRITDVNTVLNGATSTITRLEQTVTEKDSARAQEISTLRSSLNNMQIGGRNYLFNTADASDYRTFSAGYSYERDETGLLKVTNNNNQATNISINIATKSTHTLKAGTELVASYDYKTNANNLKYTFLLTDNGNLPLNNPITDVVGDGEWHRAVFKYVPSVDVVNPKLLMGVYQAEPNQYVMVRNAKLELGSVPSDWTPAPEDGISATEAVEAKFNSYKSTQAVLDKAQTDNLNSAVSRLGTAEGKITNIETTKANKTEVVSLARTTLKAEWDKAASDAARSEIDAFKVTYANDQSATATSVNKVRSDLNTKIDNISVGGRNLLLKSDKYYSSGYYGAYMWDITEAPAVGDDVVVTLWGSLGAGRTGIGVYNSRGYSEIMRLEKISNGVYRGVGKWKHPDVGSGPVDKTLNLYFYPNTATSTNVILKVKLEKGTVGTDWTPAPEDSRDSFIGPNILPNSDFASDYDGWSMYNWNGIDGLDCGFNLTNSAFTYAMKDSKVFWVRDNRTSTGAYTQTLAQNWRNRFSVVPGDILQASVYVAGWGMAEPASVYLGFFDLAGDPVSAPEHYSANATVDVTLYGRQNSPAEYTTLDRFHRIFRNVVVPPGAVYSYISIRFRFTPNSNSYGFFVRPQVCQISSLEMNSAAPHQVSTNDLSAQIVETKTTAATLEGKVQAMYTMKVETISGGRSVIAGLALGADGATGDSQVLMYANKFGLVNPNNKEIAVPFVVTTNTSGAAKMALQGDFIATDSIVSRHIAASQSITTPILHAPTLNAGKINSPIINAGQINSTAINNGNGNFTVDAAGNLYAKNGTFEGTVKAERIEGFVTETMVSKRGAIDGSYARPVYNIKFSYTFVKRDARRAYIQVPTFEAYGVYGGNILFPESYATLYVNEIAQQTRPIFNSTDGVDGSPRTTGHTKNGLLSFPAILLGTGVQTVRVEVYIVCPNTVIASAVAPAHLAVLLNYIN